jgi:hypothetical protein
MPRKPHPDWEPFCPKCVMKKVCDEWEAHPMECGEPMPKWVKQSLNVKEESK